MPHATLRLDARRPADVQRAAQILRSGGLVAFPTETVYGLGALGLDPASVGRIFAAKGRPADNPVILHVPDFERARPLWRGGHPGDDACLELAETLAAAFWPGPLTIVHYKSGLVSTAVTGNLDKVAVRSPDHAVARELLHLVGEPLAAPSANASGRVSPTTAAHVLESLDGRIDAVLDGGECALGIESTVVDVTARPPLVLRPGALEAARILEATRALAHREPGLPAHAEASPGLRHKHYSPLIEHLYLASPGILEREWRGRAAMLVRKSTHDEFNQRFGPRTAGTATEILPDDPAGFARGLYAALYRLERSRPNTAFLEMPPAGDPWRAARDRLARAAEIGPSDPP
jgi:L-threonylcarbamoyladenylate synthase